MQFTAQVADAVGKAHTHANKATLDKLAEKESYIYSGIYNVFSGRV